MAERRRLPYGTAEAWWLDLDAPYARRLSPDETERSARFVDKVTGERWSAARSALRGILDAYLGVGSDAISFVSGAFGKPSHAPIHDAPQIEFSLSHSGRHGLLVVSRTPVGADVEEVRNGFAIEATVASALSPAEAEAWRRLPESDRDGAFFRAWTSREAVLKAAGVGFVGPHAPFVVRVEPARPPGPDAVVGDWHLHPLDAPDGCVAVVATRVGDVVRAVDGRIAARFA